MGLPALYGMLNKVAVTLDDGTTVEAVTAIARRVMTLAKVYDHLLGTGLTRTIEFGSYLTSLCDSFRDMEDMNHRDVTLKCRCQPLTLDLDSATALGLVVTELISNSYRHAFPKKGGQINVSLGAADSVSEVTIVFADNGVGFEAPLISKRRGLGLVKRLMQQINGSAELASGHGTTWTLTFPVSPIVAPANVVALVPPPV